MPWDRLPAAPSAPARSLDPAIYNLDFGKIWIYLLAPLIGGLLGGAIRVLFDPRRVDEPATIRATGGLPQSVTRDTADS